MTKPTVLIVDDEADTRSMITGYFEGRYDCNFIQASDGDEAIEIIKDKPCDIILLDIKMPKKNGIAVLKEAKEIDPKIDILVVSAWTDEDVLEEAYRLGALDYAVKPLDLKVLEFKFKKVLEKRGLKVSKI